VGTERHEVNANRLGASENGLGAVHTDLALVHTDLTPVSSITLFDDDFQQAACSTRATAHDSAIAIEAGGQV
jgi:hypothetical protein